jgi:uncharacterized protein
MPTTHHPLIEEYAEYKDTIHDLKLNNTHFRRLAHEYEGIDKSTFVPNRESRSLTATIWTA